MARNSPKLYVCYAEMHDFVRRDPINREPVNLDPVVVQPAGSARAAPRAAGDDHSSFGHAAMAVAPVAAPAGYGLLTNLPCWRAPFPKTLTRAGSATSGPCSTGPGCCQIVPTRKLPRCRIDRCVECRRRTLHFLNQRAVKDAGAETTNKETAEVKRHGATLTLAPT